MRGVAGLVLGTVVLTAAPGAGADPVDLDREIYATATRLEVVVEEYNAMRADLAETTGRARHLARELRPLERELADRQQRVGEIAMTAYQTQGGGRIAALLGVASSGIAMDRMLLLDRLAAAQQREIHGLAAARERHHAARHLLLSLADRQRAQQAALAQRRDRIERQISGLYALRERAAPGAAAGPAAAAAPGRRPPVPRGAAGKVLSFAYGQLGKAYQWAGAGPHGFDCSGLTKAAWAAAGVALPHNSRRQWEAVRRIGRAGLRAGDLVFYYPDIHHVALYLGDGQIIHAPVPGERVRIEPIDYGPVHGYGRVR
jgi:cell wall-associated NlpC family hydrolase